MKKKLLISISLMTVLFAGCSSTNDNANATLNEAFVVVAENSLGWGRVSKVKDKETGCYYMVGTARASSSATATVTQMFIEKDGISVPYCEK